MKVNAVARIAGLIGEPARTAMLLQLMDGGAMTAGELAASAGISAQTGGRHLALMVEAGLLQATAVGRHRYHRIATAEVAALIERLLELAAATTTGEGGGGAGASSRGAARSGPKDAAMRRARSCYDHLAGRLGVAIAAKLASEGAVVVTADAAWLTDRASGALAALGIDARPLLVAPAVDRRIPCRPCMDWSERRWHLAGRLGALLCSHCLDRGWLHRGSTSRALAITPEGQRVLRDWLGLAAWSAVLG